MTRKKNEELQAVDIRDSVKVVTANSFIKSKGMEGLSLKARKLLYVAISQCQMHDKQFYEYSLPVIDFAGMMDIAPSNVYQEIDDITDELMKLFIRIQPKGKKDFRKFHIFRNCEYSHDKQIVFRIDDEMRELLLNLKGDFSQPPLIDFMKMKSPYSMALWHLFQIEMKSKKPGPFQTYEFYFSIDQLREVTGTSNKLKATADFRIYILDKAIREIWDNCSIKITYDQVKRGRTIIGFNFKAVYKIHYDIEQLPPEVLERARRILEREKAETERKY